VNAVVFGPGTMVASGFRIVLGEVDSNGIDLTTVAGIGLAIVALVSINHLIGCTVLVAGGPVSRLR
jgi:hypothetical protein